MPEKSFRPPSTNDVNSRCKLTAFAEVVNSVFRRAPARVRVREATHPRCGSPSCPCGTAPSPARCSCLALRDRRWVLTRRAYPPDLGGYPPAGATCAPAHIWPARGAVQELPARHDRRLARVEERHDQREHFAGPPCHAHVRGPGEH